MTSPRIAVVGAGLIGLRHMELIDASSDCMLAAVADPSPQGRVVADRFSVPLFADLGELLSSETEVDGVVLATPNALHVSGALQALEHGVPVLVEKPIAETVADAELIVAASDRLGVPVLIGHHRRYSPLLEQAASAIRGGGLGKIVAVSGTAMYYKPDDYFDGAPWRRSAGGGPILINLIHEIDDLRALCGDIQTVQAMSSTATRGFEVEDSVAIVLRFESGALGTFLLSDAAASVRSWEHTSGENPSYPNYPDEDCYVIAGTRGSIQVPTLRVRTYPGIASWWEPLQESRIEVERTDPLARQLAHFVAVIQGKADPRVSAREGLETLRTTLAVAEAAQSGGAVEIRPTR